jgi:release factor glutamine methyltransferase
MTVRELLATARRELAATPFATPREAGLLLGELLALGEAQLLAHDEETVPPPVADRFRALLARRLAGEPVAYLLGRREFWGRLFRVDDRVLVPRPESEHLMEAALSLPLPAAPRVLDLGTGSGCLAITLACELAGSRVVAVDRSAAALALAAANARELGARVRLLAGDWCAPLRAERFDLLVSNPPYLDPRGPVQPEVARWEPGAALWAGAGGLDAYRALLTSAGGVPADTPLLLELGDGQLAALDALAPRLGWRLVGSRRDLAGTQRVAELRRVG